MDAGRASDDIGIMMDENHGTLSRWFRFYVCTFRLNNCNCAVADESDLESLFGACHEVTPTTPTSAKSGAELALQEIPSPACSSSPIIDGSTARRTSVVLLTPPAQTVIQEDPTINQTLNKILAEQKRTNQLLEAVVRDIESFKATHAANTDSLRAECNAMAHETTEFAKLLLNDQQKLLANLRKRHGSSQG